MSRIDKSKIMDSNNCEKKTWVKIEGSKQIFEIENFQYSSTLKNMIDDLGNDPNEPIPLPNNDENMGVSVDNIEKVSRILKDFPFQSLEREIFEKLVDGSLEDYKKIPFLKVFEDFSSSELLSFIKFCNFLGIEFLLKFLSDFSVLKIKEELKN